jgi:hypothetical protein
VGGDKIQRAREHFLRKFTQKIIFILRFDKYREPDFENIMFIFVH